MISSKHTSVSMPIKTHDCHASKFYLLRRCILPHRLIWLLFFQSQLTDVHLFRKPSVVLMWSVATFRLQPSEAQSKSCHSDQSLLYHFISPCLVSYLFDLWYFPILYGRISNIDMCYVLFAMLSRWEVSIGCDSSHVQNLLSCEHNPSFLLVS